MPCEEHPSEPTEQAARAAGSAPSEREALAEAVRTCRACPLHRTARRAVPGSGPAPARLVMLGEQPLRTENRTGRAFVGRAGLLLRRALADAGVDPDSVYYTNVVKHARFHHDDPGQRHVNPDASHVSACAPLLRAELRLVRPSVVVLLGAVPTRAVLGPRAKVRGLRGQLVEAPPELGLDPAPHLVVTARPTSVRTSRQFDVDYAALVRDLTLAASL